MIQIAGMNMEEVRVYWDGRILEFHRYFDPVTILVRGKRDQRMFIKPQLIENTLQAGRRLWHDKIVEQWLVVSGWWVVVTGCDRYFLRLR